MSAASECLGCLASYLPHTKLTRVQESVIPTIMQSDINIVVAAPTGSGKTALLEAAMLRLFKGRLSPKPSESEAAIPLLAAEDAAAIVSDAPSSPRGLDRRKAVYICPMKALAFEKFTQWQERFPLLKVTMETGDQESVWATSTTALNVSDADIIITTPERWDGITRRWKEGVVWELVASVALLMLDEVHTVSEERGAVLEAVVSRMKAIKLSIVSRRPNSNTTRFVAISGTLPNVEDFAEWLQVPPAGVFTFTSADRPLPLTLHVVSYASTSNNPFAFDRFLSFKLFGLVRRFSEGRPTLVFCASRSEAINSARRIIEDLRDLAVREGCEQRLRASDGAEHMASLANDKQLRSMLLLGIAYHHAAMTMSDRNLVERMFKEHYISVICTTTTLALGVNLPAHLVIVKGTTFFKNGNREDLPLSEVAQMSGRAGRPGLDTHGIALVLTTDDKAHLYQPLQHGDSSTCVESRLHQNMVEHVNAEVALRTIHNFSLGVEWIKTTFLWIRLQRCPRHYGILFRTKEEELKFDREKFAVELMHRMLGELESHGCITVRRDSLLPPGCDGHENDARSQLRESGDFNENVMGHARCTVECTHVGRAMARRYIQLKTVEVLNKEVLGQNPQYHDRGEGASQEGKVVTTNGESGTLYDGKEKKASKAFTLADVLRILSSCSEFGDIRLRQGDRKHLNELNKMIRFPLHAGMRGGREVREDWHKVYVLIQAHLDNVAITDFSLRNDCVRLWSTAPRVAHFLADFAATQRWFSLMKNSSLIRRCMEQRVWWNGLVIKQIEGIGEALSKALEQGGIKSFADVLVADPRKLEALCGKHPPFGNDLQQKCSALPHYRLALNHNEETDVVQVVITQNNANTQRHGSAPAHHTMLLVGDTTLDAVRLLRSVGLRAGSGKSVTFDFQLQRGFSGEIVGCLMERHLLGIDTTVSITIGETRKETVGKAATKAAQQREGGGGTTSVSHSTAAATSLPSSQLTPAATEAEGKATPLTTNLELTQGEEVTNTNGFQPLVGDDQMDEEYERLIEMKSNIVSKWNSGISGTDPKGRGKRDRRGECISLTGAAQLGREEEAMEQIESFSFRGREVTLPRVSSPVPLPVTCDKQNAQQPSERFRFGLQGIVPSMLVRDRAPNRTFGPCAAASGCGDRTVFSTGPVSPALPYHYLCGGGVPPYQPQPPHWSRQSPTPWDARVAHFDRLQQPHATGTGDLLVSEGEGFFASSHPASEARARRVAWGSQEESFAPWAHLHHTMPQPAGTPIPNSRVRNGYAHQWNPSTYHAGSNAHYGRAAIRHTVVRKGWW